MTATANSDHSKRQLNQKLAFVSFQKSLDPALGTTFIKTSFQM